MRLLHPTLVLRKMANQASAVWREWRTGVPGWIIQIGDITACPHGYTAVTGWTINPLEMTPDGPLEPEEFVDRLVLAVPDCVTHSPLPDQCTFCAHQRTFA